MNNKSDEIIIHILLFMFTAGIGNVIYLIYKSQKKNNINNSSTLNNIQLRRSIVESIQMPSQTTTYSRRKIKLREDIPRTGYNHPAHIVIIIIISIFTLGFGGVFYYFIYSYCFYKSDYFSNIKKKIKNNIDECNELNEHIEELKRTYSDFKKIDYGEATITDNSTYNYKRPELSKLTNNHNVYNCSLQVCRNAQQQPFKYLCKYFNIEENEKTLEIFEKTLNDFSAVEEGKKLLKQEQEKIVDEVLDEIPLIIQFIEGRTIISKLGFKKIDFSQLYFPSYTFNYVSGGGNSSMRCDITFDIETLDRFINYLSQVINFKNSVKGQRALMTTSLREKIKKRDNYTCKYCSNSVEKEPNLLLEIDHIKPLAKGGMTTEENLQTLCWKCNRKKGAKLEE